MVLRKKYLIPFFLLLGLPQRGIAGDSYYWGGASSNPPFFKDPNDACYYIYVEFFGLKRIYRPEYNEPHPTDPHAFLCGACWGMRVIDVDHLHLERDTDICLDVRRMRFLTIKTGFV